jgi:hypothetical protein
VGSNDGEIFFIMSGVFCHFSTLSGLSVKIKSCIYRQVYQAVS